LPGITYAKQVIKHSGNTSKRTWLLHTTNNQPRVNTPRNSVYSKWPTLSQTGTDWQLFTNLKLTEENFANTRNVVLSSFANMQNQHS